MTSIKIGNFPSYVQNSFTPLTLEVQFQTTGPLPVQIITNQLKEKIIRSFLQVDFCSQYQLINVVWFSIGFYPFSWSQPCPQSYFKYLKTSFSPSSYSGKVCWGQGWAEASLSVFFVALYTWVKFTTNCDQRRHHKLIFFYKIVNGSLSNYLRFHLEFPSNNYYTFWSTLTSKILSTPSQTKMFKKGFFIYYLN